MPEKEKEKSEKHEKEVMKVAKMIKTNAWKITTIALVVILAASIATGGFGKGFSVTGKTTVSLQDAASKAVAYINEVLQGQATATLLDAKEENGLYALKIDVGGQTYNSYVTKDGSLLFPSAIDISNVSTNQTNSSGTAGTSGQTIPKTDKPVAKFFVMSFCPYGQQAESSLKPVTELLGNSATIEPHFIVSVSGNTINSLHGTSEAQEDIRQACIWKNYPSSTWWKYVAYVNANCSLNDIGTCWKDAANQTGISVSTIESCATTDGLNMMNAEEALSTQYGVQGSPTVIINNVTYSGARTSEAFKQAICSAFTTAPASCNQNLTTTTTTTSSGGCG